MRVLSNGFREYFNFFGKMKLSNFLFVNTLELCNYNSILIFWNCCI